MELNKTEDNKCCFLHFGRGVQDPLSGDQGGSLDPWTPPPPWIRPSHVHPHGEEEILNELRQSKSRCKAVFTRYRHQLLVLYFLDEIDMPSRFYQLFTKSQTPAILDDQSSLSIAFLVISNQYATLFLYKILDDGKSLSITFLAILDQYATLNFLEFFTKWPPAATLDDRKSLLISFLTISDQYATFFFQNCHQRPLCIPIFAKFDRDIPL